MPIHDFQLLAIGWLALTSACLPQAAAQNTPPSSAIRVIIQGDDMGAAHAIDVGTIQAYEHGILRSTNVIVPGPWLLEAVEMLKAAPGLDVGIHLAVTSEWSQVKWRPLTYAPSLVDGNGYFFPMVWPNKNLPPGTSIREAKPDVKELERELRAQIETAKRLIPRVSYMSTHMGFAGAYPEWGVLVRKLAAEYNLPLIGEENGVQNLGVSWSSGREAPFDDGNARAAKLAKRLETIGPGTWRMVEHAALDDPEMRAIGHPGYENVAADRAAVTAAWTSPRVMEVVRRRNIQLIGNRDALNHDTQ
jgi:predicted glycoside hydrolase/deacetylase ChbG (UPF0249 family)